MTYERFADADVVEVESTVSISYRKTASVMWLWFVGAAGGFLAALVGWLVWRSRRARARRGMATNGAYARPSRITPFNLVTTLEQMHGDQSLSFTDDERGDLAALIEDVQARFFGHAEEQCDQANLDQMFDRWHARAVNGVH